MDPVSISRFIGRVRAGEYEEYELVMFIMEILIAPAQTQWLNTQNLTIADLLNGRFNGDQEPTVQALFRDWNLKLGTRLFSISGLPGAYEL